ncbi:MAG: hypothetical protein IJJ69_01730 [Oscillospiraceae bacterium]|nr:hypothetical protein [Oscillospiraceae bacterium]
MFRNKKSVQELLGFKTFTRYGIRTDRAELIFFQAEPVNISVLSTENIESKVHHLMLVLSAIPELELIVTDSCESFDSNRNYLRKRLENEKNPAVRKLLEADYTFLDEIQTEMSSARQFLFALRFFREKKEAVFHAINRTERALAEHGFMVRRLTKPEIKRMLGLYFGTVMSGEDIPDIEGENYIREEEDVFQEKIDS